MAVLFSIPLAKIAYTVILIGLIVFLGRELYSIWIDDRLYVGNFQYFVDGKSDNTQASSFPAHVLGQHQLLRSALIEESLKQKRQRQVAAPPGAEVYQGLPSSLPEITRWQSVLSDIELKIQGFDFGKLLGTLRTWVSPPEELSGFVEKTGSSVRATVVWPARRARDGSTIVTLFDTGHLSADTSVALAIAASMAWLQAAQADAAFAKVPRDVFVVWALAWWECRYLQHQKRALGQTSYAEDGKRWRQARSLIDTLIDRARSYPEVWTVRADLIDAAPQGAIDPAERAREAQIAQDDCKNYVAAMGIAPVVAVAIALQKEIQGSLQKAKESIADASLLQPGRQIWARPAGTTGPDSVALTTTAVVVTANGDKRLLLPDFALLGSGADDTEFRLSPDGPVIARARKSDLVYLATDKREVGRGLLLARLEQNVPHTSMIAGSPISLGQVGALPTTGDKITLFGIGRSKSALVRTSDKLFATTTERLTGPGDAGAPVLDAMNRLIAMGHSSGGGVTESKLLSVGWAFDQEKLQLAP
jgi:hypothetical protein